MIQLGQTDLTRRGFLCGSLVAGAGLMLNGAPAAVAKRENDTLNVAIIGAGAQGRVLLDAAIGIPDIRFRAVCDIWEYSRRYGQGILRKSGHPTNGYEDFREMLEAEQDLDAVIVATPDFWHAEHSVACLRRGLHVYCEKLMAHDFADARRMVHAASETGRLLQIGHQRRSNPRYLRARDALVRDGLLGRITHVNAQWNRAVTEALGWPRKLEIPAEVLEAYGYENMHQFRNWRWFRRYGGGPVSDVGGHQIDVIEWFLGAHPVALMADGGTDYYEGMEWYDNVLAIFEYAGMEGPVRAFYQALSTSSGIGGYHETFLGTEGTLRMSENPAYTELAREAAAPSWEPFAEAGLIRPKRGYGSPQPSSGAVVDVRETANLPGWELAVVLEKPIHQPHLENFFDAIRGRARLTCPGELAYASTVATLKINEAVASRQRLKLDPESFTI